MKTNNQQNNEKCSWLTCRNGCTHNQPEEILKVGIDNSDWREEWKNSEVCKRITATEMFAINHGFEEWNKPTVIDFISSTIQSEVDKRDEEVNSILDDDSCECDNCKRIRAFYKNPNKELLRFNNKIKAEVDKAVKERDEWWLKNFGKFDDGCGCCSNDDVAGAYYKLTSPTRATMGNKEE